MKIFFPTLLVWATLLTLLTIDAKPDPSSVSNVSGHVLIPEEKPISRFAPPEAKPQATQPEVKIVHGQDLNKKILIALVVASTTLGCLLLSLSCCWVYRKKKKKRSNLFKPNGKSLAKMEEAAKEASLAESEVKFGSTRMMGSRKSSVAIFDYQLLEEATGKFSQSNIVVERGSGCVYRARFDDKLVAAVKKLDDLSAGPNFEKKFHNEVNWLSQIRHQNIVKLLGYCINGDTKFLIYEMMQHGSLETQLHGPTLGSALTWHLRLKIAVDVARGLEYLHENCNPPLVHRNIQLSSILLDSSFSAKLFDFGIAIPSGAENKDKVDLSPYIAPEYILDGKLTDKSDVYAFGVVLLELLMGRRLAENKASSTESQPLVKWAMPQLSDRTKLPNIVDPVIKDTMDLKHLYQIAAVAVLCVQPEASYRPLITDVLHSLIPLLPLELGGSLRLTEPLSSSL